MSNIQKNVVGTGRVNISDHGSAGHNWVENIFDQIKRTIDKIDMDFPLSGGEKEEDLMIVMKHEGGEEGHYTFFKDLDTNFPLSGGGN